MKNRLLLLLFSLSFIATSQAQKWTKVDNEAFRSLSDQRLVTPSSYESYQLDFDDFKYLLKDAKDRFAPKNNGIIINWPMPGGKMQKFIVKRSDVFHPDLAAKYPNIKAFTGHGLNDPTAVLKISMSHKGIEGMLLSDQHETVYLDRYLPKSKGSYILYKRSDYHRELAHGEGTCTVEDPNDGHKHHHSTERFGDCQLRKYRLALACTGEYATFHGGNIPDVMAEFNASLVRVNGIYEREFTITMELIANNDELIFLDGATDPYTNNDGGAMLGQNQATIDNIIGFDNYDIGHVYSTGGGGIASLRSPCTNRKARGVTGLGNPTGDPFWVDYVSHEIGHQFGGNHTQNNPCQRNGNTAVEPGSASTIMGYAGICSPNVQSNSDDYFHSVSQAEVANFVVAGNGGCAEIIPLDNSAPEIVSYTETGQIFPISTPFFLTAEATDIDNDALTYCWEQADNEAATMPPQSTNTGGPTFRSFDPSENPTRYFPALASVVFGVNGTTWEVLPSVTRDMNFNLTVRDNHELGGCTADESIAVSFTSMAGPFEVTSQNAFTTWSAGETQTVTWDVANTDMAPVSCENVDLIMSLDRGKTFEVVLIENVPNDGEQDIIVPFEMTNQGRVMVKCATSTFFDVNDRDIQITAPFATDIDPGMISICPNDTATYTLDYTVLGSDPYPVTFMVNGLPAGADYVFTPAETSEDTEVTLTITNLTSDLAGDYELEIITQGDMVAQTETVSLLIGTDQNQAVNYLSPEDGQIGVSTTAFLSWDDLDGITTYEVEVSENPNFAELTFDGSTSDNFIFPSGLESMTVYYWRVRGISECVDPEWQEMQSFQTRSLSCTTEEIMANLTIPLIENALVESEVELMGEGNINDLEVSVEINHTWIGDLTALLRGPDGTEVILFERPGVPASEFGCEENNIVATFSMSATNTADEFENMCNPSPMAIEGTFQPLQSFTAFDNTPIEGVWTLVITDGYEGDGGELVSWSIKNCSSVFIEPGVILINNILSLNDTDEGTVSMQLLEMENSDPANTFFTMRSLPMYGEIQKMNTMSQQYEALAIGDMFTQEDINSDFIQYKLLDLTASEDNFNFDALDDQSRYVNNKTFLISASISVLTINAEIVQQITCFGETDGRIEVMGMGGLPGYTFSINEGPFEEQNIFENLSAGDYSITVRDNAGTEVLSPILTIVEPDQITFSSSEGDNEIIIDAQGGTGILTYSLDGVNYTANNIIPITDGTTYGIYITDENGCEAQSDMEMTFYQIASATISVQPVYCKGEATGSISVDGVVGGLAPYTYQLDDGIPMDDGIFENLLADSYTVKIFDSAGNEIEYTDIIIEEPEMELSMTSQVTDNTITLNGFGGTPPYLYNLNGSNYGEENVFPDLLDGDYIGGIVDSNGCEVSESNIIINTSINESTLDHLKLFPNPTADKIFLGSNTSTQYDYEIRNISGQLLKKGSALTNGPLSMEDMTPGMYLLKVTVNEASKLFKISKI